MGPLSNRSSRPSLHLHTTVLEEPDVCLFCPVKLQRKCLSPNFCRNQTESLSHHLPDALCQQVRALIALRLPNCPMINQWLCSTPSSLLILLYLFGFGVDAAGPNVNVWHFPASLFSFRCVSDVPRSHDLRGGCTAGRRRPQQQTVPAG